MIHKLTKAGSTIFPATVTDAVVHPDTKSLLTDMIHEYNVSELFPTLGFDSGPTYDLTRAISVLGNHLPASRRVPGVIVSFQEAEGGTDSGMVRVRRFQYRPGYLNSETSTWLFSTRIGLWSEISDKDDIVSLLGPEILAITTQSEINGSTGTVNSYVVENGNVYSSTEAAPQAGMYKDLNTYTNIYFVCPGEFYSVSVKYPSGMDLFPVNWFSRTGAIGHAPFKGSQNSESAWNDVVIQAPANAYYFRLNYVGEYRDTVKVKRLSFNSTGQVGSILKSLVKKDVSDLQPNEVVDNALINLADGSEAIDKPGYQYWIYEINEKTPYLISAKLGINVTIDSVNWFDSNHNFLSRGDLGGNKSQVTTYTDEVVVSPKNAKYLYLNVGKQYSTSFHVKPANFIDVSALAESMSEVIMESEQISPSMIKPKWMVRIANSKTENSQTTYLGWIARNSAYINCWIYEVAGGESYLFTGSYSTAINPDFVNWFSDGVDISYLENVPEEDFTDSTSRLNTSYISNSGYRGSISQEVSHVDTLVTAPPNAKYLFFNVEYNPLDNTNSAGIKRVTNLERTPISIKDLKNEVTEIKESINSSKSGRVRIYSLSPGYYQRMFTIRAKFNEEKDILLDYRTYPKGSYSQAAPQINPSAIHLGPKELTDEELLGASYKISDIQDSTAPINLPEYWALWQQHGYCVSTVLNSDIKIASTTKPETDPGYWISTANWTSSMVGNKAVDQLGRRYTIMRVETSTASGAKNKIVLFPYAVLDENDHVIRDNKHPNEEEAISTLTVGSSKYKFPEMTSSSDKFIQVGPIVRVHDRKFIVDGAEITKPGTYEYNTFSVSETRDGYDPASIGYNLETGVCNPSSWFDSDGNSNPDLDSADQMVRFTYSFNYVGAQCSVNASMEVLKEFRSTWGGWGATQQIFFFDRTVSGEDYKAYFFIPKTKAWSTPFACPSSSNSPSVNIYRSADSLVDINQLPERVVAYLKSDDNKYLLGMSSGPSLVNGCSTNIKKIESIPIWYGQDPENSLSYRILNLTPSAASSGMKFYSWSCRPPYESKKNYYFPVGFYEGLNYYVSYFDPEENKDQMDYWYKDGENYLIYLHCFTSGSNFQVNLPDMMEGLTLEIVEKSEGAVLGSEKVRNGKIYVSYTTNKPNYIVLRTKVTDDFKEDKEGSALAELTERVDNLSEQISSESPYNDPDVLKYLTDENGIVFGEVRKNGLVRTYVKEDYETEALDLLSHVSSPSPYNDPDVLKYLTDEDNNCLGYIGKDGTVNIFKAKIGNSEEHQEVESGPLYNLIGLLANSADNVKLSNNKKMMGSLFNISTPKVVVLNSNNTNTVNLTPKISIIDDDTIDRQIPTSYSSGSDIPGSVDGNREGGYFSVLLPILLSLGAKYNKNLVAGLACEGHRVGLTEYYSSDDSYTELNQNGKCVKWLHDKLGWNVFNHSMTAQLPLSTFFVEGINSSLANSILSLGTYSSGGIYSFYTTRVLDIQTGKWYAISSSEKTSWTEVPGYKYGMPFYYEPIIENGVLSNGQAHFNRNFDFDYSWGQWFKRADELGLPYERAIVHNGSTSSVWMINAGRKYADYSIRTSGIHNYPPIPAAVNRISDVTGAEGDNSRQASYEDGLKREVDKCIAENTWMVFMSHFNDLSHHAAFYREDLTYPDKDESYPSEWIIPLKKNEILDLVNGIKDYITTPPERLKKRDEPERSISSWMEWCPAQGTQIRSFYDVLDYALSKGVEIVPPMDGWTSHGNILNIGVDRNGQTYPFDSAYLATPYTDEELSFLTVGGDLSIRYFNNKKK